MTHEYVRLSLNTAESCALKRQVLGGRPHAHRVSLALVVHLAHLHATRGDYYPVLDEIDFLERFGEATNSRTKPAAPFNRPPLDRFWHKHFSAARHIVRNIGDRWGLSGGAGGNVHFEKRTDDLVTMQGDDLESAVRALAHLIVVDGYHDRTHRKSWASREGGVTGDWIIFSFLSGQRYYLALATHEEGRKPERLYQQLARNCEAEYPFLFA